MSEILSAHRGPGHEDDQGDEPRPLGLVDARLLRNTADIAADVLRQAILEGRLQPGAPLREERLAAELGISRTPIREALLILQTEGIVEAIPKRGSFVRTYDLDQILDLYESRGVLEAHAAARAAQHMTDAASGLLRDSCDRYARLLEEQDTRGLVDEDHYFHGLIIEAAASPSLTRLLEIAACAPIMYRSSYWPEFGHVGLEYHRRIQRALDQRDAASARQLMQEHFREAAEVLSKNLRAIAEQPEPLVNRGDAG